MLQPGVKRSRGLYTSSRNNPCCQAHTFCRAVVIIEICSQSMCILELSVKRCNTSILEYPSFWRTALITDCHLVVADNTRRLLWSSRLIWTEEMTPSLHTMLYSKFRETWSQKSSSLWNAQKIMPLHNLRRFLTTMASMLCWKTWGSIYWCSFPFIAE